jgi:hypothetical protein
VTTKMRFENPAHRWLRIFFWCAAVTMGAVDAWATRFTMNPDGVSYLDMGDAYLRGDWHMAINGYWSPLYSWLLGLALKALKPSAYWEYPVAHALNFLIYLAAMGSFEFFLRAFIKDQMKSRKGLGEYEGATLPEWAWWALGYSLFLSTSLVLITVRVLTPDMCVACFVYLASGLLLRIKGGSAGWRTFVLLGVVLGLGYLAKAVMFPLAIVFVAVEAASFGKLRKAVAPVVMSALAFLAVASPFIVALSRIKGRLTFGDSGSLNYAAFVDGVDILLPGDSGRIAPNKGNMVVEDVDGSSPFGGQLQHPVKKIFGLLPTYAFGEPVGGTHPFWYDPSYWQEGIKPYFDVSGQLRVVTRSLILYCWLFLLLQLNFTVGLSVLFLSAPRTRSCFKMVARGWRLVIPPLAAVGAYLIVHTEFRFVAPFVSLLWLAAYSGLLLRESWASSRLISGVVVGVAASTVIFAAWTTPHNMGDARHPGHVYWQAAKALGEWGIRPRDKVALISNEPWGEGGAYVARLARIQIIAQVNLPDGFWAASSPTQARVIEAFRKAGAKAVLALEIPRQSGCPNCWQRLGSTPFYVYLLKEARLCC